jgi:tRNA1(Val) A37 N6-methylase TrmN6
MRSGAPEAQPKASQKIAGETVDGFHRGKFWLVQPAGKGHRAGLDAMLLAAAVPSGFTGRLADLGAGAGAAGLAVAARCPEAVVTLVEASPAMALYAERSIALAENGLLASRASVLSADVTLTGEARTTAGLADRSFDFAIMNPPFNAAEDRTSPDEMRKLAHVMDEDMFERWIRTAAAIVKPRGGLALIARPASLRPMLDALAGRFGRAEIVPIHPRPDAAAIRIVLRAWKGARGALSITPPLVLHETNGNRLGSRADAICNGETSLFGD